jgi:NAD(P)-dependent dehydrogenase (short-subunit alcohol dehydrogenase family)
VSAAAAPDLRHASDLRVGGLQGRVAVVSGAASGIGWRVAEVLAAQGARVAAADLAFPDAPAPDGAALAVPIDVADEASVDAAMTRVEQELGPIDVLVTCAGVFREMPFDQLDLAKWNRTLSINLNGTFLCARRVAPQMAERGYGRVVLVASGAGLDGGSEACADYAASKGGVIILAKALSKEYAHRGVTANVVVPRAIRTPMIAGLEDACTAQIPVGRIGEPDDVAAAAAYLCSSHASFITGEAMVMNGGWW